MSGAMAKTRALKASDRSGVRIFAETANILRNSLRGRAACSAGQEVADLRTVGLIQPGDTCNGAVTRTPGCGPWRCELPVSSRCCGALEMPMHLDGQALKGVAWAIAVV